MLTELHIENIAVIERADVEFGPGFNALTGETGAGKSILIDAISAVTGGRTDRGIVRTGAEKAVVSAEFSGVDVSGFLTENEIEDMDGTLILQRRISPDGKTSCRINGMPATVRQLRELGDLLLDIHGQNDARRLLDEANHLSYLDRFGTDPAALFLYREAYDAFRDIRNEMDSLTMDEVEKERLTEQLNYKIREISQAELKPGEQAELSARAQLMRNAEKLSEALDGAYAVLYENEENAISCTLDASAFVSSAAACLDESALSGAAESLRQARFLLEDAAETVSDFRASLDFSEEAYNDLETRLSLLRRLEKKYGRSPDELLSDLDNWKAQLESITGSEEQMEHLKRKLEAARTRVKAAGSELTRQRTEAARLLAERIEAELRELNMPSVQFQTELTPCTNAEGFDSTGCDCVRFVMSANAGQEPGPIAKIASGGEMSRIMLAMKSVFADGDPADTLIFDEIDTGVSGVAAQRVAEKIGKLSGNKQILCVTHLPQIAAMADSHYTIRKAERDHKTFTSVTALDFEGRKRELARLYGGENITESTLQTAGEQLDAAQKYKESVNRPC